MGRELKCAAGLNIIERGNTMIEERRVRVKEMAPVDRDPGPSLEQSRQAGVDGEPDAAGISVAQ